MRISLSQDFCSPIFCPRKCGVGKSMECFKETFFYQKLSGGIIAQIACGLAETVNVGSKGSLSGNDGFPKKSQPPSVILARCDFACLRHYEKRIVRSSAVSDYHFNHRTDPEI
jgi:hypothetical protein